MTWILWATTVASLVGVVLNILEKRTCFWIWMATNAMWAYVDFSKGIPEQGVVQSVYFCLAVWGAWKWRKKSTRSIESRRSS